MYEFVSNSTPYERPTLDSVQYANRKDAIEKFNENCDAMRKHGFRIRRTGQEGVLRRAEVVNPRSRRIAAIYVVRVVPSA